ncbi:hypothetical protein EP331_14425 [bacterium]|nr:MAG: hypothetical protein EP331_14425 [bacterium]
MFLKHPSYKHRLVTLGDSLTQGFQSGAIYRTDLSYPAFIAKALGAPFNQANFTAQAGLPINVEVLLRGIEDVYGEDITWDETVGVTQHTLQTLLRIKKYWEGKVVSLRTQHDDMPFHNQSLFSATISDALNLSDAVCKAYIEVSKEDDSYFNLLAHNAFYTAGRRIINPNFSALGYKNTLFSNVEWFSEHGGIENLIVYLGSNNLVGAITDLSIRVADETDLSKQPFERDATVYPPTVFRKAYEKLAEKVNSLHVKHVYTATIPIITQAPLLKKVVFNNTTYFTHVWVQETDFNPDLHPHLMEADVNLLETYAHQYNQIICEVAEKNGWHVLRVDEIVTQLNPNLRTLPQDKIFPKGLLRALKANSTTRHLVNSRDKILLNTEYPNIIPETGQLKTGGIFTLDGIHPTTIAYGLLAAGFIRLMQKNGVKFSSSLDWNTIVDEDTLTNNPPHLLNDMRKVMAFLSSDYKNMFSKLGSNLFNEIVAIFGGRH